MRILIILTTVVFLLYNWFEVYKFWFLITGNTNKTVEVLSTGQLGNQLFEYWSGKIYAKHHNKTLILNGFIQMGLFIDIQELSETDVPFAYTRLSEEEQKKFSSKIGVFKQRLPLTEDFVCLQNNQQSYHNFKEYADTIRKETRFKTKPSLQNQVIIDKMKNENSVALHVRRGDYIKSGHTLLSPSWYKKAIDYMNKHVQNPIYYIFSNDIDWVKENIHIDKEHYFITWNQGLESYNDLRLMTFCRHNIIANSTFSWWGAFLGKPNGKIVIMPDKWVPWVPDWEKELILPNWIVLPSE